MEEKIFFEKALSDRLMGCFYKTRNLYGKGHRENFYDKVLGEVFSEAGIEYIDKPRIPLYSLQTGKQISVVIPDRLVEQKIIIELKAKPFTSQDDIGQVREYLKITEYEILYLVNFGETNFFPRRYIYTKPTIISHLYRYWAQIKNISHLCICLYLSYNLCISVIKLNKGEKSKM